MTRAGKVLVLDGLAREGCNARGEGFGVDGLAREGFDARGEGFDARGESFGARLVSDPISDFDFYTGGQAVSARRSPRTVHQLTCPESASCSCMHQHVSRSASRA